MQTRTELFLLAEYSLSGVTAQNTSSQKCREIFGEKQRSTYGKIVKGGSNEKA
jgi:hypothetical protein